LANITVRHWTDEVFRSSEREWKQLLEESAADRLFLSWDWLTAWWTTFGGGPEFELFLLGAYDETGRLVGAAPLYIHRTKLRALLPLRRLQFMGNCWRANDHVRSEYVDFVIRTGMEEIVTRRFLEHVADSGNWDEFVVSNVRCDSPLYRSAGEFAAMRNYYLRTLEQGDSEAILLKGDLAGYLAALSPKTRGKLYNQRKRLEAHGKVELVSAEAGNLDEHFRTLNAFHKRRWGKDVFAGKRLEFHRAIAQRMLERNCLNFLVLKVSGRPVSALYDFRVDGTEYGYQLGFDGEFDKSLSPSFLHIGYVIEQAFASGLRAYDMLRGGGKSTMYKEHITEPYRRLATLQMVRSRLLRWFYRSYAALRRYTCPRV
jgi:CelD/BcsL family acetyltransferase involved in cellulose biosynthesis